MHTATVLCSLDILRDTFVCEEDGVLETEGL
jgi:hypothetical protein